MKRIDLTGESFGELEVINYIGNKRWHCKCSCGKEVDVLTKSLLHDGNKSCGHELLVRPLKYDLTGKTFGEWTVGDYAGNQYWNCECSCGVKRKIYSGHLRNGLTKSCGHGYNTFDDLTDQDFGEWHTIKYLGNQMYECRCSCGETRNVRASDLKFGKSKSCGHNTTSFKDLTGKTVGEWEVLYYVGAQYWRCLCSCGTVRNVKASSLNTGKSKSCGHGEHLDLTGQKFWSWTPLEYVGKHNWLCVCDCGTLRTIPSLRLRSGDTKSCGCMKTANFVKTVQSKYGVDNVSQQHLTPEQFNMTRSAENLKKAIADNFEFTPTPIQLSKVIGLTPCQVMRVVRSFDLEEFINLNASTYQYEEELHKLFPEAIHNDRRLMSGQELDLYFPEYKLAVEFNGDYWHREDKKGAKYHQDKTVKAGKLGVHIIHIFEHEWLDESKKNKLLDLINRSLNNSKYKVYARDCEIQLVDTDVAREFLDTYHLQGFVASEIYLGCYYNDKLIGLMSFGTPRFDADIDWEMHRLCWASDYMVIGGSERLLEHFKRDYDPKSIITYCDISKFNGNSYPKLGFKLDRMTDPNYRWVNSEKKSLSRYQTQKHRLIKAGLGTEEQTEKEIMENLGFYRVYDCGNMRYTWHRE